MAAVASYAQALVNKGCWLVRIEDIDPPREQPGADKLILDTLQAYGFEWHGSVCYQSSFTPHHEKLVTSLVEAGLAYPCSCSRRDLADVPRGPLGAIYPGTCRNGAFADEVSIRVRVDDEPVEFEDALQGRYAQRLESESGDFVIKRRDGLIAYHLAVVADDFRQGVTEIVRGIDLLDSTPRQIHIQRQLGFSTPKYMHIPVATNSDGQKLSKLNASPAIPAENASLVLLSALRCLDQKPPDDLADCQTETIWRWVAKNWDASSLEGQRTISSVRHGYG
jgi:glutamyl-Q tRNA(Asp) synthetase